MKNGGHDTGPPRRQTGKVLPPSSSGRQQVAGVWGVAAGPQNHRQKREGCRCRYDLVDGSHEAPGREEWVL